jgi:hypothetical protein
VRGSSGMTESLAHGHPSRIRVYDSRLRLSPLLLVAVLATFACGGRTLEVPSESGQGPTGNTGSDQDAASSESASGSSGGKTGTPFPVCPNPAPDVGWSCSTPNQGCAYVDYETGACVSFVCSNGHWISSTPAGC